MPDTHIDSGRPGNRFANTRRNWGGAATAEVFVGPGNANPAVIGDYCRVEAGAQTLVVVRRGTSLEALHDVCAHQGCSLSEGKIVGETIECGCHGSRYRLRDGLVVRGPAVFDQPHFEVREAEGKIEVRRTDTR